MSFFGYFGSSAPVVRYPHHPRLAPAMQAALAAVEHASPVLCAVDGLNPAEVLLLRKFADPANAGYTKPVGAAHLLFNAQCVADYDPAPAGVHWDATLDLVFARAEDRADYEANTATGAT